MNTNRIVIIALAALSVSAFRPSFAAEKSQAELKQDTQAPEKQPLEPLILKGSVRAFPSCARVSGFNQELTAPQVLRETYSDLGEHEPLGDLIFWSPECSDWTWQYPPQLNCCAVSSFSNGLPARYRSTFSPKISHSRSLKCGLRVEPEMCGVMITLCRPQSGWPGGIG